MVGDSRYCIITVRSSVSYTSAVPGGGAFSTGTMTGNERKKHNLYYQQIRTFLIIINGAEINVKIQIIINDAEINFEQ